MITRSSGKASADMTDRLAAFVLGKVGKVQQKGEDTYGNTYSNINQMWKQELYPEEAKLMAAAGIEIKNRVGDQDSWYKKQVSYWDVRLS